MTYRIRLIPRVAGPFSETQILESPEMPRFEGGAVILTEPVDIDDRGAPKPPKLFAWPLEVIGGVIVEEIE